MSWLKQTEDGVMLQVKVTPRSSKNRIEAPTAEALRIRLQAPPVDGKANKALIKFFGKAIGIPPSRIQIVAGDRGRNKRLLLMGVSAKQLQDRITQMTTG